MDTYFLELKLLLESNIKEYFYDFSIGRCLKLVTQCFIPKVKDWYIEFMEMQKAKKNLGTLLKRKELAGLYYSYHDLSYSYNNINKISKYK